jgi:hypothetical protein
MQLQAGDASLSDEAGLGQRCQPPAIDGAAQDFGLQRQSAFVGRRQLVAQQGGRFSSRRPTPKWRVSFE